jgi:hypothetical protein
MAKQRFNGLPQHSIEKHPGASDQDTLNMLYGMSLHSGLQSHVRFDCHTTG